MGQLRAFTAGARVLLGSLPRALMVAPLSRGKALSLRLTTCKVSQVRVAPGTRPPEASQRARGSIGAADHCPVGQPIGAALGLPSRGRAGGVELFGS